MLRADSNAFMASPQRVRREQQGRLFAKSATPNLASQPSVIQLPAIEVKDF